MDFYRSLSDSKSPQVSKDSTQYSGWSLECCSLDGLDLSSDFQLFDFLFQAFEDRSKLAYYNWYHWRCSWCNGYRRRKWTRQHEFKSWTRQIAFHVALIPLGKVWIQLFFLQLWVNSRADWVVQPWWGNKSRKRKTLNSNLLNSA